ncbi:MAG: Ig-like domain-containing protein, partial [Myxococcota bacterium]
MRSYARLIVLGGLVAGCTGDPIVESTRWTIGDGSIRLEEDGSAPVELVVDTNADQVEYEIVDQPQLGQLIGTGNQFEYVANDDVNGTDEFTWRAMEPDGSSESDVATITVFIEAVNDGPAGIASQIVTDEDTPVSGQLPADDVEGDALTFVLVSSPEFGRVDIGTDGSYTYVPDRDYTGADSFLWSALDPSGATTGPVRVDINVGQRNDPPVVNAASFTLAEDAPFNGQLSGSDADGDSLTWTIEDSPANGNLDFNPSLGTFTYRPDANYFGTD